MPQTALLVLSVIGCLLSLTRCSAAAETTVQLTLRDGRSFTGGVHARTDDQQVWLRFSTATITILRPVPWSQIATMHRDGDRLTPTQVRQLAIEAEDTENKDTENNEPREQIDTPPTASPPLPPQAPAPERSDDASRAARALGMAQPVERVEFEVWAANWDADAELDGLLVEVVPLNRAGHLEPLGGTLEVIAVGDLRRKFHEVPHGRGSSPTRLLRWSAYVSGEQLRRQHGQIRIPFQAAHPQWNPSWDSDVVVHVRYSIGGHGVFRRTYDGVRVRPFLRTPSATN